VSELKLKLDGHGIDARALSDALTAMLRMLADDESRTRWQIANLEMGSAICEVRSETDYNLDRIERGLDTIGDGGIPSDWSMTGLKAARTLALIPQRFGLEAVELVPNKSDTRLIFTPGLAAKIDAILSPAAATTWSVIAGKVVEWKTAGQIKVETRTGRITVKYDDTLRADALGAIDKHAELWGRVTKNVDGDVTQMFLRGIVAIEQSIPTPLDEVVGSLKDVEGVPQSVAAWLNAVRYGD